jgi:hypothetical protein
MTTAREGEERELGQPRPAAGEALRRDAWEEAARSMLLPLPLPLHFPPTTRTAAAHRGDGPTEGDPNGEGKEAGAGRAAEAVRRKVASWGAGGEEAARKLAQGEIAAWETRWARELAVEEDSARCRLAEALWRRFVWESVAAISAARDH